MTGTDPFKDDLPGDRALMRYRLILLLRDGTQGFSSFMTKETALDFACDLLRTGMDVLRIEDPSGTAVLGDELSALRAMHPLPEVDRP